MTVMFWFTLDTATHTNCQNSGMKKAVIKQLSRQSSEIWKSCVYCNYCTLHKERDIPLYALAANDHAREHGFSFRIQINFSSSCVILCLTELLPSSSILYSMVKVQRETRGYIKHYFISKTITASFHVVNWLSTL